MIVKETDTILEISWSAAWTSVTFRTRFLLGSVLFTTLLLCFPYFFAIIQKRQGVVLNDWLLYHLPSIDASAYIFTLIYITVIVGIFRAAQSPLLFLLFLWSCLLLSLSRIVTISLVPLDPPIGLVPLVDPILLPFYGRNDITKDLFYSGHTGSVFLIYLILQKKREKIFALIATIIVGMLLLFQHIHYVIDVVFAPVFVYFVYAIARRITNVSL
ncbi:MAG: hypothetical protein JWQ40_1187 [Segetibacter sp.]|nr:hypothetical protein [Segetibacter sp.]